MNKNILVIGITILFLGTCITPTVANDTIEQSSKPISNGNILYVGGIGPDNYTKIQDAIDNASDGDTVFVFNDSSPYNETITINKSITLQGEDKNITINKTNLAYLIILLSSNKLNFLFSFKS